MEGFRVLQRMGAAAEAMCWMKDNAEGAIARAKMVISSRLFRRSLARRKRERDGLPLLLPSSWPPPTQERMEVIGAVMEIFREISSELFLMLHDIQKNLLFWRARALGSDGMKIRFMVLERGPHAFLQGFVYMMRAWFSEGSPTQKLVYDAACRITERVTMLMNLQHQLAALLAQVYQEVDKLGDDVFQDQSRPSLCAALTNVYKAMLNLEECYAIPPSAYYGQNLSKNANARLHFDEMPQELLLKPEWTDSEIESVIEYLYQNLDNIKECMAFLMPMYERPKKTTRHWIRNSVGALGVLIVKHSRLVGSDDFEQWAQQAAEAVKVFYKEHVEEPLLSIRDDLFETFRKRDQGAMELGDVRLTAESLSRMLKAFAEQTSGAAVASNATEQQLLQIMMGRYEKELTHPLRSLLGGELARALLIQVQKLKLDIETAMLELNQILRANEFNFAILAAFPALIFAFFVAYLVQVSLSEGKGAEGKGRAAQLRRRMLVAEAERALMHCQIFVDKGQEEEALWQYGMVIYALDRLYRAVSRSGVSWAEWFSLREDILDLAKPRLATKYKLLITARLARLHECVVPVPKVK